MSHPTGIKSDLPAIRQALIGLVQGVTRDAALRQDLMQEALVHFWLIETRRPGQTKSWYLQSCKFHLQHYLATGRSVDSCKRRDGKLEITFDSETGEGFLDQADSGDSVFTNVSTREIMFLLSRHLKPQEKAVLDCLADGLGAREIGRELGISHTMVIRYRRRIAALLTRLESTPDILPSPPAQRCQEPQAKSSRAGSRPLLSQHPAAAKEFRVVNGHRNGNGHGLAHVKGAKRA